MDTPCSNNWGFLYKERVGLFTFFLFQLTHFYWSRDKSFLSLFTLSSRYTLTIFSPSTFVLFISKHYTILYHTSHSLYKCRFSNLKFSLNFLKHKCIFWSIKLIFWLAFYSERIWRSIFSSIWCPHYSRVTHQLSLKHSALWNDLGKLQKDECYCGAVQALWTNFWERRSISND